MRNCQLPVVSCPLGKINQLRIASGEMNGIFFARNSKLETRAFTLTELLVVITIIAILASLITAGAMNALNAAKRAAITTEIGQLSQALEEFKLKYGAYPPNVFPNSSSLLGLTNVEKKLNANNVVRFLRKSHNRSTELFTNLGTNPPSRNDKDQSNITDPGVDNVFPIYDVGLRPSEALVLWLMGFSSDPTRPLSGSDLEVTTIRDEVANSDINDVITFDSFDAPLFDFDKGRLRMSRNSDNSRRVLIVYGSGNAVPAFLQLYEYFPKGSQQPYVYFNTVDSPQSIVTNWVTEEFFYESPMDSKQIVYPVKKMKASSPANRPSPEVQFVEYVNQGKFQILHAGLDDAWGDFSVGALDVEDGDYIPEKLFPSGPFTGDLADTLTNFSTGTLESEQE